MGRAQWKSTLCMNFVLRRAHAEEKKKGGGHTNPDVHTIYNNIYIEIAEYMWHTRAGNSSPSPDKIPDKTVQYVRIRMPVSRQNSFPNQLSKCQDSFQVLSRSSTAHTHTHLVYGYYTWTVARVDHRRLSLSCRCVSLCCVCTAVELKMAVV